MNTEKSHFFNPEFQAFEAPERIKAEGLLLNIVTDRLQGQEKNSEKPSITPQEWQDLSPEENKEVVLNLEILAQLNGHQGSQLRGLVNKGKSESAKYLKTLYDWSISQGRDISEIAAMEPPLLLAESLNDSESSLFEKITYTQSHELGAVDEYDSAVAKSVAKIIGLPEETKWKDMVDQIFKAQNQEAILEKIIEEVGFIPTQLLTKKKFRSLGAKPIVSAIDSLRSLEKDRSLGKSAQFERAKLINYFITSDNANEIRKTKAEKNITLDANGIFINLRGFHSHLPFGLINDELAQKMLADNWVDQVTFQEINIRRAQANSNYSELPELQAAQLKAGLSQEKEESEKLIENIISDPESYGQRLIKKGNVIPDLVISECLEKYNQKGISALMKVAEAISLEISEETEDDLDSKFHNRKLNDQIAQSYDNRSKVLNSPDYYNATKIIRAILDQGISSDPENQFALIRGQYKKSKQGDQHSFIESINQGQLARVLINEDKHLNFSQIQNLNQVPLFERQQYDQLEAGLMTFNHFTLTINNLKNILRDQPKGWQADFYSLAQSASHFVLTNVTQNYQKVKDLIIASGLESSDKNDNQTKLEELLDVFNQTHDRYAKFLYSNIGSVADFEQKFSPEVEVLNSDYGKKALEQARKNCSPDGFDPELFEAAQSFPVRIAKVKHKINDPSETIPHHLREECLDAIRISRDRPLINVIGGCRYIENQKGQEPLDQFAQAVVEVGHQYQANIGVPGSQSGIGITFGKKNIEYKNQFGDLSLAKQTHLFSINPGANSEFAGNDYPDRAPQTENFALTPVDSIITPTNGDWDLSGREKLHSRYLNHIAYMEALYDQMSANQPKIVVVGNGGLYSIAELNESLERGFEVMLINDSGRFAEIASVLLEQIDKIDLDNSQDLSAKVLEIIKNSNINKKVIDEYQQKDFGKQAKPETEDYEVYRIFLTRFLELAKTHLDKIKTTSLADLQQNLDQYLASQIK